MSVGRLHGIQNIRGISKKAAAAEMKQHQETRKDSNFMTRTPWRNLHLFAKSAKLHDASLKKHLHESGPPTSHDQSEESDEWHIQKLRKTAPMLPPI